MKVFIKTLFVAVVLLLTMSNGETANFAAGLNFGILYLFFTPYLLLAVIAFFWYRNSRKNVKNLHPSGNRSW